ncbi:MAG: 16S rRNA (cytosine(1402)-N(4))-methyltransferase RsmH [Clostridiales bacterium]|jgi:16S rRNA (cytosine1402-N4)-methyltransferase|nr:16S rRNA (cytosine(1402)-N(4))-methyltransferase RsmH [Clostridiales bacterium]
MEFKHIPVMLGECVEGLNIKPDGIYLDGTLGGAGHSLEIVKRLNGGRLIAVDKDGDALIHAGGRLKEFSEKITFVHDDFKNVAGNFERLGIDGLDGVLLDLGVSSYQIDNAERGFSYRDTESKIDMRMDRTQYLTAFNVVNEYPESSLVKIFYEYGEERFAKNIAANIVEARNKQSIRTTGELSDIITRSIPLKYRYADGNPCKRAYQAIRLEVNGELTGLGDAITGFVKRLKKGGRIAVISFHSLEDRIAKQTFKYLESSCVCDKNMPVCTCGKKQEIKILTKKPLTASAGELKINGRAESAKLRIAEKII